MPKLRHITLSFLISILALPAMAYRPVGYRYVEICRHVPKFGLARLQTPLSFLPEKGDKDMFVLGCDTLKIHTVAPAQPLVESDYYEIALQLDVEVAAIKAVVEIETGRTRRGFNRDLSPIVNFNTEVFRTMAGRHNIDLDRYVKSHPLVFQSPDSSLYENYQRAQHQRLRSAMSIDTVAAIEGTFWGMFQIGGFNWRKCGVKSPAEFVRQVSSTERGQLELFACFLQSSGLVRLLRKKDWTTFARRYNGPSYEDYNYHNRLAAAYDRFSEN